MSKSVYLCLGSNLGDRVSNLNNGIRLLSKHIGKLETTSYLYETEPWGIKEQPKFLNAACKFTTSLTPDQLLNECKGVEKQIGRSKGVQWGPRVLDIDIAFYEDQVLDFPNLSIPHPRIQNRDFVMKPLCDMDPDFVHPVFNKSLSQLYSGLTYSQASNIPNLDKVLPVGRGRVLSLGKQTYIMGILNTTPDSFSDGGLYGDNIKASIEHAIAMETDGATFIDVGGESTRPGADRVSEEEELNRVVPVIEELRYVLSENTVISIDTTRAGVASAAIKAGADLVNDISGGTFDDNMLDTVHSLGVPIILMHTRGTPKTMRGLTKYENIISDIGSHLQTRVKSSVSSGIPRWMCVADPGIGFAKDFDQNFYLLREMKSLCNAMDGLPVLVGTSRKGFIGHATGKTDANQRVHGTGATCAAAIAGGADILRVHDVSAMVDVAKISDRIWRH